MKAGEAQPSTGVGPLNFVGIKMAKLTSKERNDLPKSDFALPGKRGYPVNDRSHAVNALARASQFGTAEVKAKVRQKVYEKFPDLKKHSEN